MSHGPRRCWGLQSSPSRRGCSVFPCPMPRPPVACPPGLLISPRPGRASTTRSRRGGATEGLRSAERAVRTLPPELQPRRAELTSTLATLRQAITDRSRVVALREANTFTRITGEIAAAYPSSLPPDVGRLDYLGRALEVWSESGDPVRLAEVKQDVRTTWARLRPLVQGKGGAAEAGAIDAVVTGLDAAHGLRSHALLASRLLDAVDKLETLFRHGWR